LVLCASRFLIPPPPLRSSRLNAAPFAPAADPCSPRLPPSAFFSPGGSRGTIFPLFIGSYAELAPLWALEPAAVKSRPFSHDPTPSEPVSPVPFLLHFSRRPSETRVRQGSSVLPFSTSWSFLEKPSGFRPPPPTFPIPFLTSILFGWTRLKHPLFPPTVRRYLSFSDPFLSTAL